MGLPMRMPTTVAWVVVALMVALAPLFHAICIAPAEAASATHVMADGTVMTVSSTTDHGDRAAGAVDLIAATGATAQTAQEPLASAMPATELLDAAGVVVVIVVFAGLGLLWLAVLVRRCRMLPARGIPPRRGPAAANRRDPCARSWTDVDLHRLGISRT
ncbi:hypothetical protein [Agromyces sp. H66]|uniref:hypothetical protein n=1 Tax=Agromyces sp. H66 TaxID=2529859 RepID=UPI0010AADFA9|nr:hypothetical protein [Agromyces sp. H66]